MSGGQLPLRSPDALVEPVYAPVHVSLNRVATDAPDPLERPGQVDGHVRILDERGDEHLEVEPGRLLVPFALNNGIALGAEQTHVAVKDVDGREAVLEAVELEEGDTTSRRVALLVETWVVPEEQHLSVSQIDRLGGRIVIREVPGVVEVCQELAHIAESLLRGSG